MKKLTINQVIHKAINIHSIDNKAIYEYPEQVYNGSLTKMSIICKKHGLFNQTISSHLSGVGCKKCAKDKDKENNILYKSQYKFSDCKNKKSLSFDFYLPNYNMCIEYGGRQHFEAINKWGGKKRFDETQINDNIKTKYCKINNIKLFRISYIDDTLSSLKNTLNNI